VRVLILNQFFYPDISATSQLMTDLAEDLTVYGAQVTALSGRYPYVGEGLFPRQDEYKSIRILRAGSLPFSRARFFRRAFSYFSFYFSALWQLLRAPRQDIILVLTTPPLIGLVALSAKWLRGTRVVQLVQDLYPEVAVELGLLPPRHPVTWLSRWLARFIFRHVDAVIVLGECMRKRLLALGVDHTRLHVIQNWASSTEIRAIDRNGNPFVREQGLNGSFTVLYSGNMGQAHDFRSIRAALKEFASDAGIQWVFIGSGPKRQELEQFLRENKIPNARVLDYQPREALSYSLGCADISIVSLVGRLEGLVVPSKLYGVMASGRPVLYVGPTSGEAARTILENDCGFICDNADTDAFIAAIRTARSDPAASEQMGRRARAAFEATFDRPILTRRYFELLCSMHEQPRALEEVPE
jgi:colanic acid biosynthesis glycosyl transferase WcaI